MARMAVKVDEAAAEGVAWPRIASIGDSLRASIVASDASGLRAAWEHVLKSPHWRVVRMKNKFRAAAEEVVGGGRSDAEVDGLASPNLHANVLFGEGGENPIVAEIQIHYLPVIDLKKSSHKLYQVARAETANDARA